MSLDTIRYAWQACFESYRIESVARRVGLICAFWHTHPRRGDRGAARPRAPALARGFFFGSRAACIEGELHTPRIYRIHPCFSRGARWLLPGPLHLAARSTRHPWRVGGLGFITGYSITVTRQTPWRVKGQGWRDGGSTGRTSTGTRQPPTRQARQPTWRATTQGGTAKTPVPPTRHGSLRAVGRRLARRGREAVGTSTSPCSPLSSARAASEAASSPAPSCAR